LFRHARKERHEQTLQLGQSRPQCGSKARLPRKTTNPTLSSVDSQLAPAYNYNNEEQAMKWEIEHNKKEGILVVKTSGLITWDDNLLMAQEALTAAIKHKTQKVLVDHRLLQANLTVLQIDDLPGLFREIGIGPEYKVAILFDPASPRSGNFTFFQNVSIISSLQFRVFSEIAEAIEWLKTETETKKPTQK
jgi:SpoIIAA-like